MRNATIDRDQDEVVLQLQQDADRVLQQDPDRVLQHDVGEVLEHALDRDQDPVITTPSMLLIGPLLPASWPDRAELLRIAGRLDAVHGGDASNVLLDAWPRWRGTGALPADAQLRDLLAAIGTLLGGVAFEMKARRVRRQPTTHNEPPRWSQACCPRPASAKTQ